jgi:transcription elongation factor Elf1
MDRCGRLVDSSPLSVQCRSCGLAQIDDYELMDANSIQSMRCADCGTVTHFAVFECPACGGETLFTSASLPASEELRNLICDACEQRHGDEAVSTVRVA